MTQRFSWHIPRSEEEEEVIFPFTAAATAGNSGMAVRFAIAKLLFPLPLLHSTRRRRISTPGAADT